MPVKNRSKWLGLAFLALLASFPVFVGFYFADPRNNVFFHGRGGEQTTATDYKKASRILQDKVFLLKGSSLTVNNTRLVYKGLHDKHIILEYYLLELDPDCPYHSTIPRADTARGIRMGDGLFHLVSVGRNALTLQMDHLYTPH